MNPFLREGVSRFAATPTVGFALERFQRSEILHDHHPRCSISSWDMEQFKCACVTLSIYITVRSRMCLSFLILLVSYGTDIHGSSFCMNRHFFRFVLTVLIVQDHMFLYPCLHFHSHSTRLTKETNSRIPASVPIVVVNDSNCLEIRLMVKTSKLSFFLLRLV